MSEKKQNWHISDGGPIGGPMLDITAPELVEVSVSNDGKVLWVNVDGVCRLRASKIGKLDRNDPAAIVIYKKHRQNLSVCGIFLVIAIASALATVIFSVAHGREREGAVCPPYPVGPSCRPALSNGILGPLRGTECLIIHGRRYCRTRE